jgi:hypothetical protein
VSAHERYLGFTSGFAMMASHELGNDLGGLLDCGSWATINGKITRL